MGPREEPTTAMFLNQHNSQPLSMYPSVELQMNVHLTPNQRSFSSAGKELAQKSTASQNAESNGLWGAHL